MGRKPVYFTRCVAKGNHDERGARFADTLQGDFYGCVARKMARAGCDVLQWCQVSVVASYALASRDVKFQLSRKFWILGFASG